MPRKRNKENLGLPKRWKHQHNAYYYQVPIGLEHKWNGKKLYRLGKTLPEAYKEWAQRLEHIDQAKTINELLDRYELEIVPTKAKATQQANHLYIKNLRKVFGLMDIDQIEPKHIYEYVDKRKRKKIDADGKVRGGLSIAKREVAMFSDAYTRAVMWGYLNLHPFKGQLKLEAEKGRDRYVENWELDCFLSLKPKRKKDTTLMLQAYASLKVITGLRQQDLLSLKVSSFNETGIDVDIKKTGQKITIEWTEALRRAVDYALDVRPVHISPYLFCNRRGQPYYNDDKADPASGFKSIFKRYMKRVLEETQLEGPFTEHDLRAKTASDLNDIEHAQKLLAHTSMKMTKKYVRKRTLVRPAQ